MADWNGKCDDCGRFMPMEPQPGSSYATRYCGHPPCPDFEQLRCKRCTDKLGPLVASPGIAEWTAGVVAEKTR